MNPAFTATGVRICSHRCYLCGRRRREKLLLTRRSRKGSKHSALKRKVSESSCTQSPRNSQPTTCSGFDQANCMADIRHAFSAAAHKSLVQMVAGHCSVRMGIFFLETARCCASAGSWASAGFILAGPQIPLELENTAAPRCHRLCQRMSLRKRTWLLRLRDSSRADTVLGIQRLFLPFDKGYRAPGSGHPTSLENATATAHMFLLSCPCAGLLTNDTNKQRAVHRYY